MKSKTNIEFIKWLRFPLIVSIVFTHTDISVNVINNVCTFNAEQFSFFNGFYRLIAKQIGQSAVPLFFLISGFLFFYQKEFTLETYKNKLKNRIHTLLIPYIFWNIATFGLLFIAQCILGSLLSGSRENIADCNIVDFLKIFWANDLRPTPICTQLWFMRDLILLVLCSPIYYYLIRKFKKYFLFASLAIFLAAFVTTPIPGFSAEGIFYFTLGAYCSIFKINMIEKLKTYNKTLIISYLLLLTLGFFSDDVHLFRLMVMNGAAAILLLAFYFTEIKKTKIPKTLTASTFFIYVFHMIPLGLIKKSLLAFHTPQNNLDMMAIYLFCALLTITTSIIINKIMKLILPRFTAIICGGRL